MSRWNMAWLLVVPAVVILGVAVTASAPPPDKDFQLVRTVVDVLAEVDKNYVRELNDEEKKKLITDMINGGLSKLDPHSEYFTEEEYKQFENQTEGHFGGVGMLLTIDAKTALLKVESPMPGTPAYDAGIGSSDLILKIGDKSTENMRIDEARKLIMGPPGTDVTLTILPEGARNFREVTLKRAIIEIHPVKGFARNPANPAKWDFLADPEAKIALIRLEGFTEKTDRELTAAIADAEKAGAKALILDMRDNPGGLLTQAVKVSNLFLDKGTIVSTKDRNSRGRQWVADPSRVAWPSSKPMAVLINRQSASASEIVASALQENKRAVIIGERSYGKGSVQKLYQLGPANDPDGAVKLTSEVWLTSAGKNIHRWPNSKETDDWGVRPDAGFDVKLSQEERLQYILHMRQLETVRGKNPRPEPAPEPKEPKEPNGEKGKENDKPKEPKAEPYKDRVLDKAIEYLRGKLKAEK